MTRWVRAWAVTIAWVLIVTTLTVGMAVAQAVAP